MKSVLLFVLFISLLANAQDSFTISGFVKDAVSGEELLGTNILLYKDSISLNSPPFSGTSANNFGFYAFPKLPVGNYILIARYVGYKTAIKEIIKHDGTNLQMNIDLIPEDVKLKEIIVRDKSEEKDDISTIDISPELILKLPTLSGEGDLFKILGYLPGVKTGSEISSGLYLRGGSPDQTLTLIDGVVVYNPSHLGNLASTFNSSAVQSIKLIKGAFPAEYGGRLSGILDLKLKSGTKEKEKGVIGLGLINSFFALEGPLKNNATYLLSGRTMYYDVLQRNFSGQSDVPRYNFYDLNGKINYDLGKNGFLALSGMFSSDNVYSGPSLSDNINYEIKWNNSNLSLNWLNISSPNLLLSTILSYVNYNFQSNIGGSSSSVTASNYFSDSDLNDVYLRQNIELRFHKNHTFKTGADLAVHVYKLLYSDNYSPVVEIDPTLGTKITSTEAAVYFQLESNLGAHLKTNAGGRIYYFGSQKYLNFEPRFSASYFFNENFAVKAAFSSAHQFIHLISRNDITLPTDLWYPSTSGILPGRSNQFVLGIDSYLNNNEYQISIEAYYRDMKNLYEFGNSPKLDPINRTIEEQLVAGKGEAYGVEFFINKKEGDFSGWIGYTLSFTKRLFSQLNRGRVYYPRYDRRHDLSVVLSYDISNSLNAGITWNLASGQHFTIPPGQFSFNPPGAGSGGIFLNYNELYGEQFPLYHRMDININYKTKMFNNNSEFYISIYNLYNKHNTFSQHVVFDEADNSTAKIKRINLFPIIPTFGVKMSF